MPMKPSRIVLSSSSPNGLYLSYYSTRCPKLPSKLVLVYFAGADRHAASTVERPTFPRTALVVRRPGSCVNTLDGRQPAEAGSTARFEPGTCPITPEPIPALQTAQCGFLVVPESRSTLYGQTIRLPVAMEIEHCVS